MPKDMPENWCDKSPHNCVQVVVPSRHSKSVQSTDFRVKRPTPDGGEVEVTAIFDVP